MVLSNNKMEENKIIIYQTEDGQTQIDVRLENDTVWLTQAQMAELFQKDRTVITRHINNVFNEGELEREEVCAKFAHTTRHGAIEGKQQTQETVLYNLDVIISVGYRVKSKRGTAFRIWARKVATRKMTPLKVVLARSIRLLEERSFIPALRKRPLCCYIWSRRTILSAMATSALLPHCSCGS